MSLIFALMGKKKVPCWIETGTVLNGALLDVENLKYVISNEDAIAHVKKMNKPELDPLLKLFCPDLKSTRRTPVEILRDYVVMKMKDELQQKPYDKASVATSETKGASASIASEPQDDEEETPYD
jgi:hypothetical protein